MEIQFSAVNGEHPRSLADAQDLPPGQPPVDISRQRGQAVQPGQMGFSVQHGLIKMGRAPTLGNIEAKAFRQLLGGFSRDGVAPGAKGRQLISVPVKGKVAVHHAGYADSSHAPQRFAVPLFHIPKQRGIARLKPLVDILHGIGPDAVFQSVFPIEASGSNGLVIPVDQHRLDAGGTELNAQDGVFKIH